MGFSSLFKDNNKSGDASFDSGMLYPVVGVFAVCICSLLQLFSMPAGFWRDCVARAKRICFWRGGSPCVGSRARSRYHICVDVRHLKKIKLTMTSLLHKMCYVTHLPETWFAQRRDPFPVLPLLLIYF